MIKQVLRLTSWDVSKLRRRWPPWILLVFIVLLSQLNLWESYFAYQHAETGRVRVSTGLKAADGKQPAISISCLDIRDGKVESKLMGLKGEFREVALQEVETLRERCPDILKKYEWEQTRFNEKAIIPNSLSSSLTIFAELRYVFIMILAALTTGEEYSWGTVRQVLARGCGRRRFLAIKVLSLMAVTAFGHMVILSVVGISSIVISISLTDTGIVTDAASWVKVAVSYCKSIYAMLPYVILGMFFSVVTSSASSGIVLAILFFIGELLLRWITFLNVGSDAARFFISASTTEWMKVLELPAFDNLSAVSAFLNFHLYSFLVILAYIIGFGGTASWLFHRRDMHSSRWS